MPAGTGEHTLQLVDDPAVAAHRPVEALQVGVDDEGEVVQVLTGGEPDRGEGLWLVGLTVADETPHVRGGRVGQAAGGEVAVEPCLVDRVQRADAQADRGELPELTHRSWMRVGRQPAALPGDLAAEQVEPLRSQPPLEERAGVDSRAGMTLEEHLVTGHHRLTGGSAAVEEVVEADLQQRQRGGVGRPVSYTHLTLPTKRIV